MVKQGDKVKIHYTGKLEDGTIFDSSAEREPLEFTVGSGQIIPGFEKAVLEMGQGEKKTINIPSDEAYGPYREEMVMKVEKTQLPPDLKPEVGQQLKMSQPDGSAAVLLVKEIAEKDVTLDANHPLAGKTLIFELELVGVA
jgi:peptidylprolyl isomerase